MGVSQAFSIFLLFLEQILKDCLEPLKKEVSAVQSDLIVSKNVVMKDILKYSHKYLTSEVIQGIRIFQFFTLALAGNRTPVSRVAGENSSTTPPTHFNDRLLLTRVYLLICMAVRAPDPNH